ncbi:hypothetical protein [Treponema vincentii]|uniref:hypothetical protein n=1 Tax=Treponema vincentii TaxID=69710 RepID=UPI001E3FF1FA|nr:hypothetical protein [Treponema vincentii]
MEYIEIKSNIITGHYCGAIPEKDNPAIEYRIVENCAANIGDDIRLYTDLQTGTKKPLAQLVKEGLVPVPEGKKLNEAGTDFVDMTEAEKVAAGLIQLKADEKVEGAYVVKKTEKNSTMQGLSARKNITHTLTVSEKPPIDKKRIRWVCR